MRLPQAFVSARPDPEATWRSCGNPTADVYVKLIGCDPAKKPLSLAFLGNDKGANLAGV